MKNIAFSHRPKAGISVGAYNQDGTLIVAFALSNDGTSRNGIFHRNRRDSFSRPRARQILESRVASSDSTRLTMRFNTDMSGREFMQRFRPLFKPTIDESDTVFCEVEENFRYRMQPNAIISTLEHLVEEVINARISV